MPTEYFSIHDVRLFAAGFLINALFCLAALRSVPWPAGRSEGRQAGRIIVAGVLMGAGIWGTFLIALMGYFPLQEVLPGPLMATASFLMAVTGSIAAFAVAAHGEGGTRDMLLAGSLLSATASCMLFATMSVLAAPLALGYDLAGVLTAMVAGALLLGAGLRAMRRATSVGGMLMPAILISLVAPIVDLGSLGSILPFSDWETASATPTALALHPMTVVFLSEVLAVAALTRTGASVDRRAAARDRQENERLRQLADSAFEGIVVHRGGSILDANTAFCQMGGWKLDALIGTQIAALAPGFAAHTGVGPVEADLLTGQGGSISVEMLSRAITLGDGEAEVVAVRDIRERRAAERSARDRQRAVDLEREAAEARERQHIAEQASQAKSRFLAMMSHEIRTPLNAVLGLASTLLHDGLTAEQHRTVGVIHESGDTLLRILNDILDFSRLDAGRLTLENVPFSPADLTRQVVEAHQPAADAKAVTMLLQDDPNLPPLLRGDPGRVRQVLHNLISNAVKFTDQGGIVVHARCLARGIASATLEWTITDTGIGISADNQAKLFDAFVQADDSITRRFGGSGLGLAISRQLAERMGGSISVESCVGQGSSFTVQLTLPLAEADPPKPVAAVSPADALSARLAAMGRPAQILLAEDNRTNQFLIQQILKDFAIELDITVDGNEAVKASQAKSYDLICMDVRMPIMDGLEATRHIRTVAGPCQAIPILAMTANAFREDQQACVAAGMSDFVPKPISRQALIEAIWRALPAEVTG